MLNIRLQRTGKKGQAYFRVIVVEHTKKPKGKYLELLGSYDPHMKKFVVKKDKIDAWIAKGAQVTPTVNNLMVNYKIWDKPKMQSWKAKKKVAGKPVAEEEAPKTEDTSKEEPVEAVEPAAPAAEAEVAV